KAWRHLNFKIITRRELIGILANLRVNLAHNPKVAGSSPAPATKLKLVTLEVTSFFMSLYQQLFQ
ncbi:hypothetical protein ACQ1PF_10610, partial [Ornithobacterium rhinotracheale]